MRAATCISEATAPHTHLLESAQLTHQPPFLQTYHPRRASIGIAIGAGAPRPRQRHSLTSDESSASSDAAAPTLTLEEAERRFGARVSTLRPGASFGELALEAANMRRTASVYALERTTLVAISRVDYSYYLRDVHTRDWEEKVNPLNPEPRALNP